MRGAAARAIQELAGARDDSTVCAPEPDRDLKARFACLLDQRGNVTGFGDILETGPTTTENTKT